MRCQPLRDVVFEAVVSGLHYGIHSFVGAVFEAVISGC